jgi:two-component system sensor histidine kinase CpxA
VVASCTLEADARMCRIVVREASSGSVRGDRELLRRAFDNVLRNAIHYAPQGSDIDITLSDDGDQVAMSVRDYGPGMPDDLLPRIFEPFFRVDVTRSASTGGVGLGLAIVRRIIDLHHGTLKAENENPGLRVTIAVPLSA